MFLSRSLCLELLKPPGRIQERGYTVGGMWQGVMIDFTLNRFFYKKNLALINSIFYLPTLYSTVHLKIYWAMKRDNLLLVSLSRLGIGLCPVRNVYFN